MNKVGWIIFAAVTALLLGGLIVWNYLSNPPINVSTIDTKTVIAASDQNGNIADHTKGSPKNTIILTEYGDYQCPGCGGAYPYVNQLVETNKENVTFVFRNLPLTSIHPNARAAASAAEAAGLQGKYWEMHDLIYEGQSSWSSADVSKRLDIFQQYAEQLGLDVEKFKADLGSDVVSQKIRFDQAVAKKDDATATPTFYLNGEKLDDETSQGIVKGDLSKAQAKIDELIKKQGNTNS